MNVLWRPLSPDGSRDRDGSGRDQSSNGDMRPGEGAEVQENGLTVLNLDVGHDDGCGVVRDVVRRCEGEGGPKRAALARSSLDRNRQTVRFALRDHDLLKNRFNPERKSTRLNSSHLG